MKNRIIVQSNYSSFIDFLLMPFWVITLIGGLIGGLIWDSLEQVRRERKE